MTAFATAQEALWAGEFGNDYIARNQSATLLAANVALFSRVLSRMAPISTCLELGANIGLNLKALKTLCPALKMSAVEINGEAVKQLSTLPDLDCHHQSILDFTPDRSYDLVLIKTVLIHINPARLPDVYDLMYRASQRYICLAEYYNRQPVEVLYRGKTESLFKRDFAGELMDRHPDLSLVDYGFVYKRDRFPQDDITWFLLEKK